MATSKLKAGLASLAVVGAATTMVIQYQSHFEVREENESLRRQIGQLKTDNQDLASRLAGSKATRAPRLPAPPLQAAAPSNPIPSEALPISNLYAQLLGNKPTKLTAAQVEPYLDANRRNAASLLAAFRTTDDQGRLQEAMQRFPNDPEVAFEAALRKDASPTERRQWLDAFKQSASENALANYISAADHFRNGRTDQAVEELLAASAKPQFQDYSVNRVQNDEEAYRAAGYSVAEAKIVSSMQLLLPQLARVKELSGNMVDVAKSYGLAGDEASRQAILQMAVNLGQRYSGGSAGDSILSQLVGVAVERSSLSAMDPISPYGADGQTVQARLDQLAQHRTGLQQLSQQADPLFQTLSEQDWISYHNRSTAFGEQAALRWLISKHGDQ